MKKTQILINKPLYLGLSMLVLSKSVTYEFRYDYLKPKYSENVKLFYMDTGSFIFHVKTDDTYKDIAEDTEKDLTLQVLKTTDPYLKEKLKK